MKKRVKVPAGRPREILTLAKNIYDKHAADGDASLLKNLDWKVQSAMINEALAAHLKAEDLRRQIRILYERRDILLKPVTACVRNCRDILTGSLSEEMKTLGLWGFDVLNNKESEPQAIVKPNVQ